MPIALTLGLLVWLIINRKQKTSLIVVRSTPAERRGPLQERRVRRQDQTCRRGKATGPSARNACLKDRRATSVLEAGVFYLEPNGAETMFQRPSRPMPISHDEVSETRFKRFMKEFGVYERHLTFEDTLDSFLDLYSLWMRTHEPSLKLRLVLLAFELHRLDHSFECNLAFAD